MYITGCLRWGDVEKPEKFNRSNPNPSGRTCSLTVNEDEVLSCLWGRAHKSPLPSLENKTLCSESGFLIPSHYHHYLTRTKKSYFYLPWIQVKLLGWRSGPRKKSTSTLHTTASNAPHPHRHPQNTQLPQPSRPGQYSGKREGCCRNVIRGSYWEAWRYVRLLWEDYCHEAEIVIRHRDYAGIINLTCTHQQTSCLLTLWDTHLQQNGPKVDLSSWTGSQTLKAAPCHHRHTVFIITDNMIADW